MFIPGKSETELRSQTQKNQYTSRSCCSLRRSLLLCAFRTDMLLPSHFPRPHQALAYLLHRKLRICAEVPHSGKVVVACWVSEGATVSQRSRLSRGPIRPGPARILLVRATSHWEPSAHPGFCTSLSRPRSPLPVSVECCISQQSTFMPPFEAPSQAGSGTEKCRTFSVRMSILQRPLACHH